MARLEWHLLEVGHCLHPECGAVRGGRWKLCEFPSLVALLKHPSRGWLLFDTGYSQRFFDATAGLPERLYRWVTPVRFDPRHALVAQLRGRGIEPSDIGAIILSHFHADHVSGVLDFPGVPVYCSLEGWKALHSRGRLAALRIGLLAELAPSAVSGRMRFFEDQCGPRANSATGELREYDLFGDGSIGVVELPGHSPGHFGLRFTAEDDRDVMLIGDAAWSTRAVRENNPPPIWSTAWLGSTRVYRQTLGRLHSLTRAMPEMAVVPSHCAEWRP